MSWKAPSGIWQSPVSGDRCGPLAAVPRVSGNAPAVPCPAPRAPAEPPGLPADPGSARPGAHGPDPTARQLPPPNAADFQDPEGVFPRPPLPEARAVAGERGGGRAGPAGRPTERRHAVLRRLPRALPARIEPVDHPSSGGSAAGQPSCQRRRRPHRVTAARVTPESMWLWYEPGPPPICLELQEAADRRAFRVTGHA